VQTRVRLAFKQHGDILLNAMLTGTRNQKYTKMKFLSNIQDSDYNYIRRMYATAGYEEFAAPAKGQEEQGLYAGT
jgi:phosphonate transport system substrate-binding protein